MVNREAHTPTGTNRDTAEGGITISKERAAWLNSIPQEPMPPIMTQGWRVFMEDYIRDMQGTPNIIASTGTSKRELKKAHSQDRN